MTHAYVSVETILSTGALDLVTSTAHVGRLLEIIEAVSVEIDHITNRRFQPEVDTRYYDGKGGTSLLIGNLISVTSLKEDTNMDGTFDTTWNATAYFTAPWNADPTSVSGNPFRKIEASPYSNTSGSTQVFTKGRRNFEVVGTFGFVYVARNSGASVSGSITTTATSFTVSTAGVGVVEHGNMIAVGTEFMYVRGVSTASNTLVVDRARYGSTAFAHDGSSMSVFQYPAGIREATYMQVARLFKRRESGFANEIVFPEAGSMPVFRGFDPDIKQMIARFRRRAV